MKSKDRNCQPSPKGLAMRSKGIVPAVIVLCAVCLEFSRSASAIPLPDSSSCSSPSGGCLQINQNGTGVAILAETAAGAGVAVVGISDSSNGVNGYGNGASTYGVYGEADGNGVSAGVKGYAAGFTSYGVWGYSFEYTGVYGNSNVSNGVLGATLSTTNAAVSAVSPSSSGLAYWGTGGIIITGSLAQKAGGGAWTAPSDRRIKKDVSELDRGLSELMRVKPVRFKYNGLGGTTDDGREYVGVIAQDLERVMPSMVSSRMGRLHPNDAEQTAIKQVDPSDFTYLLINAVQEQQKTIQRQEARISLLEKGKAPLASSMTSIGGIETGLAVGLLPIGIVVAVRRRKKQPN